MEAGVQGGCLCGACGYSTDAEAVNARICHCRICQKATGGPFFARILVPLDRLNYSGPIKWYNSSPELQRGFCVYCGTALFSKRESQNVIGISVGSLNRSEDFKPHAHIWTAEKQHWLNFDDDLPQYCEGAPAN